MSDNLNDILPQSVSDFDLRQDEVRSDYSQPHKPSSSHAREGTRDRIQIIADHLNNIERAQALHDDDMDAVSRGDLYEIWREAKKYRFLGLTPSIDDLAGDAWGLAKGLAGEISPELTGFISWMSDILADDYDSILYKTADYDSNGNRIEDRDMRPNETFMLGVIESATTFYNQLEGDEDIDEKGELRRSGTKHDFIENVKQYAPQIEKQIRERFGSELPFPMHQELAHMLGEKLGFQLNEYAERTTQLGEVQGASLILPNGEKSPNYLLRLAEPETADLGMLINSVFRGTKDNPIYRMTLPDEPERQAAPQRPSDPENEAGIILRKEDDYSSRTPKNGASPSAGDGNDAGAEYQSTNAKQQQQQTAPDVNAEYVATNAVGRKISTPQSAPDIDAEYVATNAVEKDRAPTKNTTTIDPELANSAEYVATNARNVEQEKTPARQVENTAQSLTSEAESSTALSTPEERIAAQRPYDAERVGALFDVAGITPDEFLSIFEDAKSVNFSNNVIKITSDDGDGGTKESSLSEFLAEQKDKDAELYLENLQRLQEAYNEREVEKARMAAQIFQNIQDNPPELDTEAGRKAFPTPEIEDFIEPVQEENLVYSTGKADNSLGSLLDESSKEALYAAAEKNSANNSGDNEGNNGSADDEEKSLSSLENHAAATVDATKAQIDTPSENLTGDEEKSTDKNEKSERSEEISNDQNPSNIADPVTLANGQQDLIILQELRKQHETSQEQINDSIKQLDAIDEDDYPSLEAIKQKDALEKSLKDATLSPDDIALVEEAQTQLQALQASVAEAEQAGGNVSTQTRESLDALDESLTTAKSSLAQELVTAEQAALDQPTANTSLDEQPLNEPPTAVSSATEDIANEQDDIAQSTAKAQTPSDNVVIAGDFHFDEDDQFVYVTTPNNAGHDDYVVNKENSQIAEFVNGINEDGVLTRYDKNEPTNHLQIKYDDENGFTLDVSKFDASAIEGEAYSSSVATTTGRVDFTVTNGGVTIDKVYGDMDGKFTVIEAEQERGLDELLAASAAAGLGATQAVATEKTIDADATEKENNEADTATPSTAASTETAEAEKSTEATATADDNPVEEATQGKSQEKTMAADDVDTAPEKENIAPEAGEEAAATTNEQPVEEATQGKSQDNTATVDDVDVSPAEENIAPEAGEKTATPTDDIADDNTIPVTTEVEKPAKNSVDADEQDIADTNNLEPTSIKENDEKAAVETAPNVTVDENAEITETPATPEEKSTEATATADDNPIEEATQGKPQEKTTTVDDVDASPAEENIAPEAGEKTATPTDDIADDNNTPTATEVEKLDGIAQYPIKELNSDNDSATSDNNDEVDKESILAETDHMSRDLTAPNDTHIEPTTREESSSEFPHEDSNNPVVDDALTADIANTAKTREEIPENAASSEVNATDLEQPSVQNTPADHPEKIADSSAQDISPSAENLSSTALDGEVESTPTQADDTNPLVKEEQILRENHAGSLAAAEEVQTQFDDIDQEKFPDTADAILAANIADELKTLSQRPGDNETLEEVTEKVDALKTSLENNDNPDVDTSETVENLEKIQTRLHEAHTLLEDEKAALQDVPEFNTPQNFESADSTTAEILIDNADAAELDTASDKENAPSSEADHSPSEDEEQQLTKDTQQERNDITETSPLTEAITSPAAENENVIDDAPEVMNPQTDEPEIASPSVENDATEVENDSLTEGLITAANIDQLTEREQEEAALEDPSLTVNDRDDRTDSDVIATEQALNDIRDAARNPDPQEPSFLTGEIRDDNGENLSLADRLEEVLGDKVLNDLEDQYASRASIRDVELEATKLVNAYFAENAHLVDNSPTPEGAAQEPPVTMDAAEVEQTPEKTIDEKIENILDDLDPELSKNIDTLKSRINDELDNLRDDGQQERNNRGRTSR